MKVYSAPPNIPHPKPDYVNFDFEAEQAREAEHSRQLKEWLIANGYNGERTGEIFSEPHADGYAQYMLGDKGGKSILIHLPYGDRYNSPNVQHLPRKEVLRRMDASKKLADMFAKKKDDEPSSETPAPRV